MAVNGFELDEEDLRHGRKHCQELGCDCAGLELSTHIKSYNGVVFEGVDCRYYCIPWKGADHAAANHVDTVTGEIGEPAAAPAPKLIADPTSFQILDGEPEREPIVTRVG
ncbi:hypothetical protein HFN87_31265 [Rhizobium laguerreae]|uniref:hypothetical protein n=1 Tax=Rhizobium laguerreae TaxID=1076926 RepID=UPI001C92164A|nr:hypothetical protein [Rhizobium laguerreae]MBY3417730.1 hypothetical protein [Rhizobium laguerreae]